MSEHQTVQTGNEAAQVLDNEAYKHAMDTLKGSIVRQWKECPVRDSEGQRLLLQLVKLADLFDGILRGMIESGKLAQSKIDLDELRNESKGRRVLRKVLG